VVQIVNGELLLPPSSIVVVVVNGATTNPQDLHDANPVVEVLVVVEEEQHLAIVGASSYGSFRNFVQRPPKAAALGRPQRRQYLLRRLRHVGTDFELDAVLL
jgi:hypothetical protein